MTHDAAQKLELRLVPADGAKPDYQVFDDIVRLIRQAHAVTSPQVARVTAAGEFRRPDGEETQEARELVSQVQHDIEQASENSQADVAKRAEVAQHPDAANQVATQARLAAEQLLSAVGRALIRGVDVHAPDAGPPPQT